MLRAIAGLSAFLAVTSLTAPVDAQITEEPKRVFPDPRKFAHGIYADAEMGSLMFLGQARKPLGFGVTFGARVGYDLLHWLALQVHGVGSTHRTDFGQAPESGQLIQLYQVTGELKLTIPIRQVSIFAFGGGGFGRLSTNLLGVAGLTEPDQQNTIVFLAGGGLDYHTLSRHFSFGLQAGWTRVQRIEGPGGVIATAYVRHTF